MEIHMLSPALNLSLLILSDETNHCQNSQLAKDRWQIITEASRVLFSAAQKDCNGPNI
jgi:hypothetical protein